jgi:penicillin amidase
MTRFAPLARLPRPARWAVRTLLVLLVLVLVLTLYVRWTIHRAFPQTSGRITVTGLSKDVTV